MYLDSAESISTPKSESKRLLLSVLVRAGVVDVAALLRDELGQYDLAHVFVFSPNKAALQVVSQAAKDVFETAEVTGCTTAGQIGREGYTSETDTIIVALRSDYFATSTVEITGLNSVHEQDLIDQLVQARSALAAAHPNKPNGFAFLMVDGLSLREDFLAATIAPAMGSWPVFGGSSGDGDRFEETWLAHNRQLGNDSALLTFVSTQCETRVFSLNHLEPTERRMVVTKADPAQRIVKEINAEPAAREYARYVNKDPEQLDEFTFCAHPVVVRLGDTHHVRSIQRVNEDQELVFFAAIDEGMVLNVAEPMRIATHLETELAKIKNGRDSVDILACDCMLRRLEAEQTQSTRALSDVLRSNRVVGFSTYGEQIGPLHVNQTMTGVMLVNPDA